MRVDIVFLRRIGHDRERVRAFASGFRANQRHRSLRRWPVAIGDGHACAFTRKQHAHRPAIADRRIGLADIHLPAANDQHAPSGKPSATRSFALRLSAGMCTLCSLM
jgi:hypothetical protein